MRRSILALAGLVAICASFLGGSAAQGQTATPAFTGPSRADDPAVSKAADDPLYPNEPATAIGADGTRYVAWQLGSQLSLTRDGGRTWEHPGGAELLTKNLSGCSSASDI